MKMSKRQYRIGDLAEHLQLKKFVLRFWEKELNISSHRSKGGQRFYEQQDFETFKFIKELLYERKFTLAGAKKELELLKTKKKSVLGSKKTQMQTQPSIELIAHSKSLNIYEELIIMKEKLKALQELL